MTLHSALSLPVMRYNKPEIVPLSASMLSNVSCQLRDCELFVCDELSMVGQKTMYCVDTRFKQIKGNPKLYGDVNVLLVGDSYQLDPVMDTVLYKPIKTDKLLKETSLYWKHCEFYELTEIMRQQDKNFTTALSNFRDGKLTKKDFSLIKTRELLEQKVPKESTWLYYSNAEVNAYNFKKLEECVGDSAIALAIDTVTISDVSRKKSNKKDFEKQIVNKFKLRKINEKVLEDKIHIKTGIKYMIIKGIDTSDGLVNGAIGTVERFEMDRENNNVTIIWMNFKSKNVGNKARLSYMTNTNKEIIQNLVPIKRIIPWTIICLVTMKNIF